MPVGLSFATRFRSYSRGRKPAVAKQALFAATQPWTATLQLFPSRRSVNRQQLPPELGGWDTNKAVKLNWVDSDTWSGPVFFTDVVTMRPGEEAPQRLPR
jgi:hypothetical protein